MPMFLSVPVLFYGHKEHEGDMKNTKNSRGFLVSIEYAKNSHVHSL